MRSIVNFCLLSAAMTVLPSEAQAGSERVSLNLRADVEPFCRLWTEAAEEPIQFNGANAQLGSVREVCNTSGGYTVRAAFTNVSDGSVVADGETADVAEDGTASFRYGQAGAQRRNWQLVGARKVAAEAPVYLRLSISPL